MTMSCETPKPKVERPTGNSFGWLAERSNAAVLKTVVGATPPGVRIPHHPPQKSNALLGHFIFELRGSDLNPRPSDKVAWGSSRRRKGPMERKRTWECPIPHHPPVKKTIVFLLPSCGSVMNMAINNKNNTKTYSVNIFC